jgi:hypothetical protein
MSNDEESDRDPETTSKINLNENLEARIRNPLAGVPRAQLLRNVEAFAHEKGFPEELFVLTKGAICKSWETKYQPCPYAHASRDGGTVAQSPAEFLTLDRLNNNDRAIIRYEYDHRWSHPWDLYMTIIVCSIGAATQ